LLYITVDLLVSTYLLAATIIYVRWNFNSDNYLFTTDTK